MNYRSLIIWMLFLLFCYSLRAQDLQIRSKGTILPQEYLYLVGGDLSIVPNGETTRFVLADSSYIDLYYYTEGDSVLFIRSQCAPKCSSFVRVYTDEWSLIRHVPTPRTMIFPEAYIQDGKLLWRENFVEDESPK